MISDIKKRVVKEHKESKYFRKEKKTIVEEIITNMAYSLFCAHPDPDYFCFRDGEIELTT